MILAALLFICYLMALMSLMVFNLKTFEYGIIYGIFECVLINLIIENFSRIKYCMYDVFKIRNKRALWNTENLLTSKKENMELARKQYKQASLTRDLQHTNRRQYQFADANADYKSTAALEREFFDYYKLIAAREFKGLFAGNIHNEYYLNKEINTEQKKLYKKHKQLCNKHKPMMPLFD